MSEVLVAVSCHSWPQYVHQAIDSAYRQGEVSVAAFVDIGSHRDEYGDILSRYSNVEVVYIESQGAARSRNAAFSYAAGHGYDFVLPLDDDDLLLYKAVERLLGIQQWAGAGVTYGDFWWFGARQRGFVCPEFSSEQLRASPFIVSSSLIAVETWQTVKAANGHGYDPKMDELGGWEDYLFYLESDLLGCKFVHCPAPVLAWRQHAGSRSSAADRNQEVIVEYMRGKTGLTDFCPS